MSRLPLFPLGTVLFPASLLPLHVFEERYRALVRDLSTHPTRNARSASSRSARDARSATAASVAAPGRLRWPTCSEVEPYPDGRFDVVTTGAQRFRLDALDGSRPYLQGEVTLLGEPDGPEADRLASRSSAPGPTTGTRSGAVTTTAPDDARALSYLVAAGAVLDLGEKQRLLEAADTTTRLRAELGLLRRETALLGLLPSLPAVDLTRVPASPN